MQRILAVDDHAVIRKGIQSILGAWPEWLVSGEAANGEEAVQLTKDLKPDIVLMDISSPEWEGWRRRGRFLRSVRTPRC